ncbi:MAG: trypsin-like peptidase domain-containing protein [Planctomycetes bacterium]|nr:trypsin-like peptidase domain-containing protein [Planctomycetota bacterium]
MRHFPSRIVGALEALAVFLSFATNLGAAIEKSVPHSRRNPVVDAVEKTKAAIVAIRVPRPHGAKDRIGAGVIIDERGYILTNHHVVGAARQVRIRLADDADLKGQVVWTAPEHDLAVIRIHTDKDLQALALAAVDDLMVGETVIAVGHPFGYANTVSTGIISALGREIEMPSGVTLTGLIQTSAGINIGNSGGPLLNINGECIGINVALRDGAQGIAFAIHAGTIRRVLETNCSALKMSIVYYGVKRTP